MKALSFFLFFFCASIILNAQTDAIKTDTLYLNADGDSTDRSNAKYYQCKRTNGNNELREKFTISGIKVRQTYLKQKLHTDSITRLLKLHGKETNWYDSGKLKSEINYIYGEIQDDLKTYYESGQLKRHDVFKKGQFVEGKCFDEAGQEKAHFPYQIQPEFEGGQQQLFRFIGDNIGYPIFARKNSIKGTVYVGFVVSKKGDIIKIKIKKSVHPILDEEAMRVVKKMPKWKPGLVEGEPVNVAYTLPIKFKLE